VYLYSYDEDAGYRIHDAGHKIQEGVDTMSGVCGFVDTK